MKNTKKSIFQILLEKEIPFTVCKATVSLFGTENTEYNIFICKEDAFKGFRESSRNMFIFDYELNAEEIKIFKQLNHFFKEKNICDSGCMYELISSPLKDHYKAMKIQRIETIGKMREQGTKVTSKTYQKIIKCQNEA